MINRTNHKKHLYISILLLLLLFEMFVNPSNIYSATYYVAKNGNDENSGTETLPWLTIQKAANTVIAGDKVYIKHGIYKETIIPKNSGTQSMYITYQAYAEDEVIIDAENGIRDNCIRIDNVRYLYFNSLKLQGGKYSGFNATSSNNIILDNIIAGPKNRIGVYFNQITDSTIKNCEISYNQHGIYLNGPNNNISIENNHVSYSAPFLPEHDKWGHNITLQPGGNSSNYVNTNIKIINNKVHHAAVQGILVGHSRNILVENNYSHHNGATGIQIESWKGQSDAIENPSQYIIVEANICEYNSQSYTWETGIWVDDSDYVVVQNNIIRHNETGFKITGGKFVLGRYNLIYENNIKDTFGDGVALNGTTNTGGAGHNHTIVHNALFKNGKSTTNQAGLRLDLSSRVSPVGTVVKNNIISETSGTYDLSMYYSAHTIDYNDYYNTRPLSVNWQNSTKTWPQYLSLSGKDGHSITQTPLFVNPANGDFNLQPNSPCIDKGDFLTKTVAAGDGTIIKVEDARYFTDGFKLKDGDLLQVGSNSSVKVVAVDYEANNITVDKSISWGKGDGVSYPYSGSAPDMGASEYLKPATKPGKPDPIIVK